MQTAVPQLLRKQRRKRYLYMKSEWMLEVHFSIKRTKPSTQDESPGHLLVDVNRLQASKIHFSHQRVTQ